MTEPATAPPASAHLRAAVEDLFTAYAHCIDDDDLERWPAFFQEDGLYQIIPRDGYEAGHKLGVMLCRGRGMMSDRVRAMRQANIYEPQRYTHILSRPEIMSQEEATGGAICRTRTNFLVVRTMEDGASETFVTGKYLDVIWMPGNPAGEAPALTERRVVLDSRRIDTLLVVPL